MPTSRNTKLPELPAGVRNPLPLRKAQKQFRANLQEPGLQPTVRDRTAKFISIGNQKKESK